ncbi:MAG TPA: PQQ-binding-like beta-propeller repeat protein [Candidatus Limnocylindrales bacterium]
MSLDFDRLFAEMAEDADGTPFPGLESVRRRSRRRHARIAAGAFSVASVVAAVSVAVALLVPAAPQPVAQQPFLPIDGGAAPVVAFGGSGVAVMTATVGGTTYARWSDPDQREFVAAIDLAMLTPLWAVTVGQTVGFHRLEVSRGAILTATTKGSSGDFELVALDPVTGRVMWRLDYAFQTDSHLLYDDLIIVSRAGTGATEAIELKTGRTLWRSGPDLGVSAMRRSEEFWQLRGWSGLPVPADRRFVAYLAGGTIQIRSVDTGQPLSEFPGELAGASVIDGRLYSAALVPGGEPADGLSQIDPQRSGKRIMIYAGKVHSVAACFAGDLLCVMGDTELVLIDAVSGRELWRRPALGNRDAAYATGTAILVPTTEGHAVYDLTGKRLLTVGDQAGWADADHLLAWESGAVSAYSVATGERTVLGQAPATYCTWNSTALACPTRAGISAWRYRASG